MEVRRTTVRDMRRSNRSVILTGIYRDGPLSRQELSMRTSLSPASVSNLVTELIAEGVVEEAGSVESEGGRPRVLLRVAREFRYVVGAEVGETRVRVELFDLAMNVLATVDHSIDAPEPAMVVKHVLEGLSSVVATSGVRSELILGVGVAVFGIVDADGVVHAQTLGWDAVPLGQMLAEGTDIPILVDNGANTLGQAEMWFGAGRGATDAVVALVGSGVGAALVAGGSSYRGTRSSAGEWGHTTIVYGGRSCRCGAAGCLEAYVGAEDVLNRYRETGATLKAIDEEAAFAELLELAVAPGPAAAIVDDTIGYLAAGFANLVNLVNPERIVLGGWAGLLLGERYLPRLREEVGRHALRQPYAQVSIEVCELGRDAVALGAATLPVLRLLRDGGALPS
ncbi:ROK family transcriptional regulator [Kribbella sandramycini]|uniref:Putative NBD/HSP70 family sugar kinase n=1 Tax=Kribbella sandramycini TaxID=60450 RepID=A0A7Y4L304_9ACTN|nr:ROK family transcriptional regulator [Kribbella sandramycini]MBB6571152.1 putative NBD/HSP70 family sugar kinase [Kribbella sandramycini]NOL43440.1 ROK family transcriptional regulator [Kribbella sandramycini]